MFLEKRVMNTIIKYIVVSFLLLNSYCMNAQDKAVATFGGGCFWCTEAVYAQMEGVDKVVSGYSGGKVNNPTYKEVCSGLTGHAEVVQITYDAQVVSFEDLLEVFFATHDPTTLNSQGADVGTQYRSAIFYHSEEQKRKAELIIAELNKQGAFDTPIVTEVTAFDRFYEAENYHQDYFANNPNQPYCRMVVNPKVKKFKKMFEDKLKSTY